MKYKFTKEEIQEAANKSLSMAETCRVLGIRPVGGNYRTLKSKFKAFETDISHFTGSAWNVGKRYKSFSKTIDLKDILVVDSTYASSDRLKKRLFKEGIFQRKCASCELEHWMGKPIPTELDHINGINTDNRKENLRILCPNCHAQTDTYRGKSKVSYLSEKREIEYRKYKDK